MKKGCGIAAALLLEGLSLCADRFASSGSRPSKLFWQAFVACHEIVKGQNRAGRKVPVFPDQLRAPTGTVQPETYFKMLLFPELLPDAGTNTGPAHCVRGWASARCPCIARPTAASIRRPNRCILEQPVRSLAEGQFIPISTAIRIRSEWFLAPSFCLSRDVVLATVL